MGGRYEIRSAGAADLGTIADDLVAGLATYRRFAPTGWSPPDRAEMLLGLVQRAPGDGWWAYVARAGGEPAGHVAMRPDRDRDGRPRPGGALLAHLFVREPHWGGGLAAELHALALADMRERGFRSARLLVVAAHGRARRFYERCGWRATGAVEDSAELALELAEYALELGRAGAGPAARADGPPDPSRRARPGWSPRRP